MKPWTIIQNDKQYEEVMERVNTLSSNPPALESDEGKELFLLGYLADKYESEKFPIAYPDPIKAILVRMEELNLSVADLNSAFGDRGTASKVLHRKRPLSLNMVRSLSEKLALPPGLLMMPIKLANSKHGKSSQRRNKLSATASRSKRNLVKKRS